MYKDADKMFEQWNTALSPKDFEAIVAVKNKYLPNYTNSKFSRLALLYLCKELNKRGVEGIITTLAGMDDE